MTTRAFSFLFGVLSAASLSLLAAAGCAGAVEGDSDEDVESAEDAVSAPRAVTPAMAATRLLQAKAFDARPPARLRPDVAVAVPAGLDATPREVRRATSRAFTWDGRSRVGLFGDASGLAPVVADDFVLVEVLDAASGELLATRTLGAKYAVTASGKPVRPANALEAGLDLTQALQSNRAFRLRLTGLDVGGKASVSDVFLKALELPADPFGEGFCSGPRMTREQALAYIPPGAQWGRALTQLESGVQTLARTSGPTGWGDWKPPTFAGDHAIEGDITSTSLGHTWRTNVTFQPADLRKNIHATLEKDGVQFYSKRPYDQPISYPSTGRHAWDQGVVFFAGAPYGSGASWAHMSSGGVVDGETEVRVGVDCYQIRNLRKERDKEILTVAYGRFAAP